MFAAFAANAAPSNGEDVKPPDAAVSAPPKTIEAMRKEAYAAFQKKQYAVARELALAVRTSTNAAPADFRWAWKMEADILSRENRNAEARVMYEKLADGSNPADLAWAAASTLKGQGRLKYLEDYLDGKKKLGRPLTDDERAKLWRKYAYNAYECLYPEGIRKAAASGYWIDGRVRDAMGIWDDLEKFPIDEKDVKFPKTLEDFGIKVVKTVHVAKDFGFDPTNATAFIRAAITSGAQRVVLENVGKPWYTRTIKLPSNIEIVLEKGVRLHTDRTWDKFVQGGIFVVRGVSNVVIRGEAENDHDSVMSQFHDRLDRARYCRDYGSSGILVQNALHIAVRNLRIADCAEDAMAFGGFNLSSDMYFENLDLDSNFRQAASLCNNDRCFFRNVRFRNTAGSEPGAGIDLEPAEICQANSSIYLYDCTFEGNMGAGLIFATSSVLPITLHAKRCVFKPNRSGNLVVFIRIGPYIGRNIKVPGKAIFEDCEFVGYSDTTPVTIESVSLLDLEFRNCTIRDGGTPLVRGRAGDAPAVSFNLNRDLYYQGSPNGHVEATVSFDNCRIVGYTNAPPVAFVNHAGHESIRNIKGVIDFNGEKIDLAKFRHAGPELAFQDIERKIPDLSGAEAAKPPRGKAETPFKFVWSGGWFNHRPEYAYLLYGEKGEKAKLLLRFPGNPGGGKKISLVATDGTKTELGEYAQGDNEIAFTFPGTGWYSLRPPASHVLVEHEGVSPVYFGGMGAIREVKLEAPLGYVGYFEVPAEDEAPFKVGHGSVTLRDATGAEAGVVAASRHYGAGYARLKSKSGKPEVWSFAVEGGAIIKFFAPFTGLWADTPEAVPAAPGAVRSPVITIERKAEVKEEEVAVADLKTFLAAHPVVAKIVKDEMAARVAWAKKGDFTALLAKRQAEIEKLRSMELSEQGKRELADAEKNIPPTQERADMEKRIPSMKPDELERYAFCQAFAVIRGIDDKSIGEDFLRCLRDGDDMPDKYPEVYWWIYKKDYDNYIRNWVGEFGLGFRDFTLICDDDRKLDKFIPVLEKHLMTFMIDE